MKNEMKKLKVHKTCPSWGVTQCWLDRWEFGFLPKTSERWKDVTCRKCLKMRGEK